MAYRIGIDTGGTFTDLVVFDTDTGEIRSLKVPSTPERPLEAFVGALGATGLAVSDLAHLVHGTTVATNALIERHGARVAFITTGGFEDIPFIQRVNRRELYNLDWDKPEPLVRSRRDCFGVDERVDHHGTILRPLVESEVRGLCRQLREGGYEAVAVAFLFSYLNTRNEQLFREIWQSEAPEVPLSLSHEVAPIWREYERSSTVIADAFLKPLVRDYVRSLLEGLGSTGFTRPLTLMKSNGGVMLAEAAAEQPIHLAMSGPAGGMVACLHIAETMGVRDVLTIDMGGTSADVGIIVDGQQQYTTQCEIEWGLPAAIPLIDIKTIGAGGGSIAWVDQGGFLQVGPHSAGAVPGPVSYDRGGEAPTVTDANLVLGRLDPDYFLGGGLRLNKPRAEAALAALAARLGMQAQQLASAIIEIANENMANAIRMVSIERGHDPRRFHLIAFGGAGPLHGNDIARRLGVPRMVVPQHPGATSALGLLLADQRVDKVWTQNFRSDRVDVAEVQRSFQRITAAALSELTAQGYDGESVVRYAIAMRYLGQNYEQEVSVPYESIDARVLDGAFESFHELHRAVYGYDIRKTVIEMVNFTVTVHGATPKPGFGRALVAASGGARTRSVYFTGRGWLETRIIRRSELVPGHGVAGPAIIEEEGSTTLVEPGSILTRLDSDLILVEVAPS